MLLSFWKHSRHKERVFALGGGVERRRRSWLYGANHEPVAYCGVHSHFIDGGIVGRLFQEFAVTLSAAVLVSLLVSLTTTPMLCALWLRPVETRSHGRYYYLIERFNKRWVAGYDRSLRWALRHGPLMMLLLFCTIGLNIYLYTIVPKGFFPVQDTGRLSGTIQADQSIYRRPCSKNWLIL